MKKDDIKAFKNTKRGNRIYPTLNKLLIDGILCLLCAIFIIVTTLIFKDGIFFYFLAAILVIFGIYCIYMSYNLKKKEINMMKRAKNKKESKND